MSWSVNIFRIAAVITLTIGTWAANAQTASFEVVADGVQGGYIPALSTLDPLDPNRYIIGLDPSNSLSTGIFNPTKFSSGGVSADTLILNIRAPNGFIVSKIQISHSYVRTSSRGGTSSVRQSVIVDDVPFLTNPGIIDLTSQNKQDAKLSLTSFLNVSAGGVASASIAITSASIKVTLAPARP